MNAVAETYVRLVLAVGRHDPLYVDAYYGPDEWRPTETEPLETLKERALNAQAQATGDDDRARFLHKQLGAVVTRIDMLRGVPMTFEEESAALYDVVDESRPDAFYADLIARLDSALPGTGPVAERYEAFRSQFFIPADRLVNVFQLAIDASRERSKRHIPMADGENFRVEYVRDKVWSAYNWYQGNSQSLIQVNVDHPMSVDRVIGLACHEGYPGHHVYNALLERHLVRERGYVEFSVYPLFSPQSLIAEGTAEYGVELNFPEDERLAFERDVLYPAAGIDPVDAESFALVRRLVAEFGFSSNDAARRYLDGKATREETIEWLVTYGLSTPARAEQRVRFIEVNRSYVVTYGVGEALVRRYVESRAKTSEERWRLFAELLSNPRTPSSLREGP